MPGPPREHQQRDVAVACEWGPAARAIAGPNDCAIVCDVLSFSTAVTVAVSRGWQVYPHRWKDETATRRAAQLDATLAVGRLEGRGTLQPTLSPAQLLRARVRRRLVLPSPNGSTISGEVAGSGAHVVIGCLRNRIAVARHARQWLEASSDHRVLLVPAGERWQHDDSLRPAVEDLWAAGAVVDALAAGDAISPEARLAAAAFQAAANDLGHQLEQCASGQELSAAGFSEDIEVAAALDVDRTVPVMSSATGAFDALAAAGGEQAPGPSGTAR